MIHAKYGARGEKFQPLAHNLSSLFSVNRGGQRKARLLLARLRAHAPDVPASDAPPRSNHGSNDQGQGLQQPCGAFRYDPVS